MIWHEGKGAINTGEFSPEESNQEQLDICEMALKMNLAVLLVLMYLLKP